MFQVWCTQITSDQYNLLITQVQPCDLFLVLVIEIEPTKLYGRCVPSHLERTPLTFVTLTRRALAQESIVTVLKYTSRLGYVSTTSLFQQRVVLYWTQLLII